MVTENGRFGEMMEDLHVSLHFTYMDTLKIMAKQSRKI